MSEQLGKKLEFKVGAFMAVGLAAVLVAIVMLGGDKSLFSRFLRVRAQFSSVQGLFPGSVVSLEGMPVGNVEKIDFADNDKLELTLKINRKYAGRVVEGTVADIRTQGALGDKYVYLQPGPAGKPVVTEGTLLTSTEEDFMKLLTGRNGGVEEVLGLIKELHALVAAMNQGGQTQIMMKNFADASGQLKATLTELDAVLADVHGEIPKDHKMREAIVSLAAIMDKINTGKGTLGQLINDPSLHQSLKAFLGSSPQNRYMKDMLRETLQHSSEAK